MQLALIVLLLFVKPSFLSKCDSFKDVEVTVITDKSESYETKVDGCIERVAFEKIIIQTYARHQKIPRLGRDSIRNMKHLLNVQFYQCQLDVIEPGAFRNVPSLKSIQIVKNDLAAIPNGVFQLTPNLEILKLNNNRIDSIEDGSFANVPLLKKVYLSNNQLETFNKSWFTNTTSLQLLDFRFNKIRILPKLAFYNFDKLKEIYFDYNELHTIQADTFKGLTQLDYLGLRYNRLKTIDNSAFPNLVIVKSIAIDANYLNFVPVSVLKKVQVSGEAAIQGNPWNCFCLDLVLSWLRQTNATVTNFKECSGDHVPVCSFPKEKKTCHETIDEEVSTHYYQELNRIDPALDKFCARRD